MGTPGHSLGSADDRRHPVPSSTTDGVGASRPDPVAPVDPRNGSRYRLAAFMATAGVSHFVVPNFYERIVPKWFGHERSTVRWSGVAEIGCAVLLIPRRTKRLGAWATVGTLLAVYPANIQMAVDAGRPARRRGLGGLASPSAAVPDDPLGVPPYALMRRLVRHSCRVSLRGP